MLESLNWEQTNKNIFVTVKHEDKNIKFKIEDRLILHLIGNSPKIYFFTINIKNNKLEFLADFSALKPIIKSRGKLSFKVKVSEKEDIIEENSFGNYVIARGESFHERFLGVDGWQTQEYLFSLIPLEQQNIVAKQQEVKQNIKKIETKTVNKVVEQTKDITTPPPIPPITPSISHKEQKSKFQECVHCGNILISEFDTCPYCFKLILQPEEGVDFAI